MMTKEYKKLKHKCFVQELTIEQLRATKDDLQTQLAVWQDKYEYLRISYNQIVQDDFKIE